jgi:4'-phosphopantetheinyl transferase
LVSIANIDAARARGTRSAVSAHYQSGETDLMMSDTAFLYYLLPHANLSRSMLEVHRSVLSPEECEDVDSRVYPRHREEKLVARALLRRALSDLTGLAPSTWQLQKNEYGRPEIAAPGDYRDLQFSVSHAGGLIACLLSWHRKVGVDVESAQQIDGMLNIADRYFIDSETAFIRALPGDEQSRGFLELWTLKEAYLKARGLGLSVPLSEVAFTIRRGTPYQISAAFGPSLADEPERWQFALERLDNHIIAAALERRRDSLVKIAMHDAAELMRRP